MSVVPVPATETSPGDTHSYWETEVVMAINAPSAAAGPAEVHMAPAPEAHGRERQDRPDTRGAAQPAGAPHDREFMCPVVHAARDVGCTRRRVDALLARWNVSPDVVEDALLVISELVTNAVTHALPPAVLKVTSRRGILRIEVTDGGPTHKQGTEGLHDEHGRGICIVTAVATQHGTVAHAGGVTHWAELHPVWATRPPADRT